MLLFGVEPSVEQWPDDIDSTVWFDDLLRLIALCRDDVCEVLLEGGEYEPG